MKQITSIFKVYRVKRVFS